jgi:hypothetical protein
VPIRALAANVECRFDFALAGIDDVPQQAVGRLLDVAHSATISGRTQCTRDSASGEPKRPPRGGGASKGMVSTARGPRRCHRRSSSRSGIPVPHDPRRSACRLACSSRATARRSGDDSLGVDPSEPPIVGRKSLLPY